MLVFQILHPNYVATISSSQLSNYFPDITIIMSNIAKYSGLEYSSKMETIVGLRYSSAVHGAKV